MIDWLRQYDIIKKMERMGKSVGMIAGQVRCAVGVVDGCVCGGIKAKAVCWGKERGVG